MSKTCADQTLHAEIKPGVRLLKTRHPVAGAEGACSVFVGAIIGLTPQAAVPRFCGGLHARVDRLRKYTE